jgi:hypothetical protein
MSNLPLLLPGTLLGFVLGLVVAAPLAASLGVRRPVAVFLVTAIALVVAATLTPTRLALDLGFQGSGVCDLRRWGLPTVREWRTLGDPALNVLLFAPLGLAVASLAHTRRTLAILALAVASPVAIEIVQLVLRPLGRGCQSVDVVDNLAGLVTGLAIGTLVRLLTSRAGAPPDTA